MPWVEITIVITILAFPRQVTAVSLAIIAAVAYQWATLGGLL